MLPAKGFCLWQCLCRIIEFVFGEGRNGWTEELSAAIHKIMLQHNILVEEVLGKAEC